VNKQLWLISFIKVILISGWMLCALNAQANKLQVNEQQHKDSFALASKTQVAPIIYSPDDFKVVALAANDLAADIERVTGRKPELQNSLDNLKTKSLVVIGTLGKSPLIDQLISAKKLDVSQLQDQWESFLITHVKNPFANIENALVIVGSDRRGTAFGVYELSQAIGVSPWYWWADVAPAKKSSLYIKSETKHFGPPSVKYRGIFINDEDWGMQAWAKKIFEPENGGIGPKTYQKLFELLLRLKANSLWPAMHPGTPAFNSFPQNAQLADDYAIVMGSSHAEPMLRNNVSEWTLPHAEYNYLTHRKQVHSYWQERMQTNGKFENIYTLGMRGIHDSLMQGPTNDNERISLLQTIFADQRKLIAEHTGHAPEKISQMFCAYKEVLGLYRQDLNVPDDVTIVWPDDNFGYLRHFTQAGELKRLGGFGVYYHLSYLGAPMAYLWLSTTPPGLIWLEMNRAYAAGADRIWIVNVGDLKPAEIGTEFFLQMAWDIKRWQLHNQSDYLHGWATREFGKKNAKAIAELMQEYYHLNFQRRPEHLQWWLPNTTPVISSMTREESRERLLAFKSLYSRVKKLTNKIDQENRDAFFQLVSYPIEASALANIRFLEGENGKTVEAMATDKQLHIKTTEWNDIAQGKWRYFMAQEPADDQWKKYRISNWKMPEVHKNSAISGIKSADKILSLEAENFISRESAADVRWEVIKELGPRVDYRIKITDRDEYKVCATILPLYPITGSHLTFAVGINKMPPQIVSLEVKDNGPEWMQAVLNNKRIACSEFFILSKGKHMLNIYGLDSGVILDSLQLLKKDQVSVL
jgi:hypothetical protein